MYPRNMVYFRCKIVNIPHKDDNKYNNNNNNNNNNNFTIFIVLWKTCNVLKGLNIYCNFLDLLKFEE